MQSTFTQIVTSVQQLPFEEKEELSSLLEKYLIEERREQYVINLKDSLKLHRTKKLKFSSNIDELMSMLWQ